MILLRVKVWLRVQVMRNDNASVFSPVETIGLHGASICAVSVEHKDSWKHSYV